MASWRCILLRGDLSAAAEEWLPETRGARLRAHLERCPECRARLERERRAGRAVAEAVAALPAPPAALATRVAAAIAACERASGGMGERRNGRARGRASGAESEAASELRAAARVRTTPMPPRPHTPGLARLGFAGAALLLLAAATWLVGRPAPTGTAWLATPVAVRGEVQVLRGGRQIRPSAIGPGDEVATGRGARLALAFADGSRLDFGVETRATTEGPAAGRRPARVRLSEGDVTAHVTPGSRFEVATPAGSATALGTRFRVRFRAGAMELSVAEGRVLLANAHGRTVVAAGGEAVARASIAPTAAPVGTRQAQRQGDAGPEAGAQAFHPHPERSMSLQETPDVSGAPAASRLNRAHGEGGTEMKKSQAIRAAALAAAASALLVSGAPRTQAQGEGKADKAALRAQGGLEGGAGVTAPGALGGAKGDGAVEVIDAAKLPADVVEKLQKVAPEAVIHDITRRSRGNNDTYTLRIMVAGKPRVISLLHVLGGTMAEAVTANDLPAPVLEAFRKAMPNGVPPDFEKSTTIGGPDEGAVSFTPRVVANAGEKGGKAATGLPVVMVSADGQVLTVIETLAAADVPQAVADSVQRQFPQSTLTAVQRITVNGQASFRLTALTQQGGRALVTSTPTGELQVQKGDGMKPAARPADGNKGGKGDRGKGKG